MNRNKFLKLTTDIGAGIISIPTFARSKTTKFVNILEPTIVRNENGKTIHIIGHTQTLKLPVKNINGSFTLIKEENHTGTGIPLDVHKNEDEVFKVMEGEMELTVGEKMAVLKPGDVAFGPKGVLHACKIIGDKKAKVILRELPAGNKKIFKELSKLHEGPPDFQVIAEICGRYGINFIS
jgi:mannose-6-phosphate isomerase-like protein (cupin superfamily)